MRITEGLDDMSNRIVIMFELRIRTKVQWTRVAHMDLNPESREFGPSKSVVQ